MGMKRSTVLPTAMVASVFVLGLLFGPRLWQHQCASARIYSASDTVPAYGIAIVLGAGLDGKGGPSAMLYDRVAVAATLYHAGRVRGLLLSGDNRHVEHNEPEAMRKAAIGLGVPPAAITMDFAGRRTYDSCYRARHIFGIRRAVVVSQRFHLDRALYLADAVGITAIGVAADRRSYGRWGLRASLREIPAAGLAAWDALRKPLPVLGKREPVATARGR